MLSQPQQLEDPRGSSIGTWTRFRKLSGWRKGAFINTILVSAVFVVLISFHIFLWAKSRSPAGYHVIHSGRCAENSTGRLNTVLHLIINILSTLVLASTNFFMQVLNAPSRAELDSAHEKGSWLDIGVPSPRNAVRVSRFKTILWILFFLSSIPIHILFNSVIFATDHRESLFSYFVFDESVLTGGATFDPGTSLALPMASFDTYRNMTPWKMARQDFQTIYSNRRQNFLATVEEIRKNKWHKLDKSDCISIYNTSSCSGIRSYQNVALILRGSSGWNRSQVWDLPANETSFWDAYVPEDVNNSLWFAHDSNYSIIPCELRPYCSNSCSSQMGLSDTLPDTWTYPLFASTFPDYDTQGSSFWLSAFEDDRTKMVSTSPTAEFEKARVSIEYCLAQPFETICQIGLASNLLWVVSFWYSTHFLCQMSWPIPQKQEGLVADAHQLNSVLLKAVLCFVVITQLGKTTSLVTPGDVIESFISHPPDYLIGSCLLEQNSLRSYKDGNGHHLVPGPLQWICKRYRRWHAIPRHIWLSSYLIFSIGIALLIYFFSTSHPDQVWEGSFGQEVENDTISFPSFSPTFEQAILIANSPQLFLSLAYLAFNGLFTRLHMAKEWSAMGTRYKALRVTDPQGQQSSTYFLQLPYRYSAPLLVISVLLHWILSGCIYLLVMQGDYFGSTGSEGPFDSYMAVGYSRKSILTMMILSVFLLFMPPIFGRMALPPNTVVVGSNSLAIAAACQVSPLVGQCQRQPDTYPTETACHQENDGPELQYLMASSHSLIPRPSQDSEGWENEEERKATLLRVSQSKIKWGVLKMPPSWAEQFVRRETGVEHISFGLPEDDVQPPVEGHWYA